ncbi:MAG: hypothetical protein ABIH41_05935 [Nanoarchaeota archaeon]
MEDIEPFKPVQSQNPIYLGPAQDQYASIIDGHGGRTFAEVKEDGYRMQVHKRAGEVRAFTRSMNRIELGLFPELQASLAALPECILDAELIGADRVGVAGFDAVKRRFRSRVGNKGLDAYLRSGVVEDHPVALRVFDTLYWEGAARIDQPLSERRAITESILEKKISPSVLHVVDDAAALGSLFDSLVSDRYEGLVCKDPRSSYVPGSRTKDWIKLKRAENLDLVVLGLYLEGGRIGQVLCGTYDDDVGAYQTLAKVNAKREGLDERLSDLLLKRSRATRPDVVSMRDNVPPQHIPDRYITPYRSVLVEVAAMNINYGKNWHSCGLEDGKSYSLRIGWLKGIRDDKPVSQVAATADVRRIYASQSGE